MRWITRLAAIAATAFAATTFAQSTQPALSAINRDVQTLYASLKEHTVRVNVPMRVQQPLNQEHPLVKYRQTFDPQTLAKLAEVARQNHGVLQVYVQVPQAITTRPTGAATTTSTAAPPLIETTRIPLPTQTATVNVEFLGLVLDSAGDVLVPLYIEGDAPLQVTVNDTSVTTARVRAADRLTALSILQLAEPAGVPVQFALTKPAAGSVVLMLAPTRRTARLGVWTGVAEDNVVMVDLSGNFSAIVRNGHALFPSTFLPVVKQLIDTGVVRRAQLGVFIHEVSTDDPIRAKLTNLGSRPAAFVQEVIAGSAAQRAGLQAGDLILKVNDDPVEDVATFAAAIANCRGKTQVHILREGEAQTIPVDLHAQ